MATRPSGAAIHLKFPHLTLTEVVQLYGAMKDAMSHKEVDTALDLANTLLTGHGVESIRDDEWERYYLDIGLLYVNMGDPYRTTILYDTRSQRFSIGAWGVVVERQEKRFAEK